MKKYLPRIVEAEIKSKLARKGCVVIEGTKWCGKSTTGKQFAKTIVDLQDTDVYKLYKLYAETGGKKLLFNGEKPIMFDEWQMLPQLWNYMKSEIDSSGDSGLFLITGSAKPLEDKNKHSGIGRFIKIRMRTMSLWESGDSTGEVSMGKLFDEDERTLTANETRYIEVMGESKLGLEKIAFLACRGGWPQSIGKDPETSLALARDYIEGLIDEDITSVDDIKRNPTRAKAILKSYARNISTSAKMTTIQGDVGANDESVNPRTLDSYINALKKLYVIDEVEAWSPALRSKTTIRTTWTRQVVDPSIATAVLEVSPKSLLQDFRTFGFVFESLCIRDLRVYAGSLDGNIYKYCDAEGLEIDAIISLYGGKWAAVEIKLGGEDAIEQAAKNLVRLKNKIDKTEISEPSFLMVLTATGVAYRRADGILVVPIGVLRE